MITGDERLQPIQSLLVTAVRAAENDPNVRAVALVGSWARAAARADSDVDLVILVQAKDPYVTRDGWRSFVPAPCTLTRTQEWGVLTELRVQLEMGMEVELGFALVSWASVAPVDPGTRQVAAGGMRPLYDPDGLLETLGRECRRPAS